MADQDQIAARNREQVQRTDKLAASRTQLVQALFALAEEAERAARQLRAGQTHHQISLPAMEQVTLLLSELDGITGELSHAGLQLRQAGEIPTGAPNGRHKTTEEA